MQQWPHCCKHHILYFLIFQTSCQTSYDSYKHIWYNIWLPSHQEKSLVPDNSLHQWFLKIMQSLDAEKSNKKISSTNQWLLSLNEWTVTSKDVEILQCWKCLVSTFSFQNYFQIPNMWSVTSLSCAIHNSTQRICTDVHQPYPVLLVMSADRVAVLGQQKYWFHPCLRKFLKFCSLSLFTSPSAPLKLMFPVWNTSYQHFSRSLASFLDQSNDVFTRSFLFFNHKLYLISTSVSRMEHVPIVTKTCLLHALQTSNPQSLMPSSSKFVNQLLLNPLFYLLTPKFTHFVTFFKNSSTCQKAMLSFHPHSEVLYVEDFSMQHREWLNSSDTDGRSKSQLLSNFQLYRVKKISYLHSSSFFTFFLISPHWDNPITILQL